MASGPDGTGPGGLAEFTNDGRVCRQPPQPRQLPTRPVIKPEFNRMVTSAWVPQKTIMTPRNKWDPADFLQHDAGVGLQRAKDRPDPERRSRHASRSAGCSSPAREHGYTISFAGNSIWMFQHGRRRHLHAQEGDRSAPGLPARGPAPVAGRSLPLHQLLPGQRDPGLGRLRPGEINFTTRFRALSSRT